jgi:hypothetical protein
MRSSKLIVALLAIAGIAVLVPALSAGAATQLSAKLKGNNEVPGPGDTNGKGEAVITVKPNKGKVCFQVSFTKIAGATAAHIHKGGPDDAGPVKVLLFEDPAGIPSETAEGCERDQKKKLLKRIAKSPEKFYVNVHNDDFPAGAIRGQLEPAL